MSWGGTADDEVRSAAARTMVREVVVCPQFPPIPAKQQMERIAQLPRAKQQLVIQMHDGVLASASR